MKYTDTSTQKCPDCEQDIWVSTAGSKNLEIHHGSKACQAECERKAQAWQKPKEKWNRLLHVFFRLKAAMNQGLYTPPPPI